MSIDTQTIAHVDPRTLLVEVNVRRDAHLTPAFVDSIREHGVLTPVLVHRTGEGLRVRAGQRRTLAAIEAGRDTIPAYVVEGDDDEVRRILEQLVENEHREQVSDNDHVAAFEQLSLLGVPADQIARRAGVRRDRVDQALTVAASKKARAVAAKYDLTIDQAAVLADFEKDKEAITELAVTAAKEPEQFDHVAQRLRDERQAAQEFAVLEAALKEQGTPIIPRVPYDSKSPVKRIDSLANVVDGEKVPLTEENHATCPHRAVWANHGFEGWYLTHLCTAPKDAGHVDRYAESTATAPGGKMTEEQKQERATVVANNKAWKSAEKVRRTWLATFAKRKAAPKDAPQFIAARLLDATSQLERERSQGGNNLARTWLGVEGTGGYGHPDGLRDLVAAAAPARAQQVALVIVLGAIEASTGVHTWRSGGTRWVSPEIRGYFQALQGWGYTLSPVEALLVAEPPAPAEDVDDEAEVIVPDEAGMDAVRHYDPEEDVDDAGEEYEDEPGEYAGGE
jgi:ParB family transcriptional regulator, chromosome partitioning protein